MIAHTTLHVDDLERAMAFYVTVLTPLGYRVNMTLDDAAGFSDGNNTDFWIVRDQVAPTHLAFEADSRQAVEAFYRAALDAGARDNGAPGYRDYWPGYYAAFVLDLDGHNIEAVWYDYDRAQRA